MVQMDSWVGDTQLVGRKMGGVQGLVEGLLHEFPWGATTSRWGILASPACNDGKAPGHGETLGHPGCVAGSYVARCP